ncbi:MAG: HlyD family efflux transporter periplasmic adaptor subunit [Aquificae bacterium]|nr:HlyD family efflux transporter periplasmic adaptor subunit [Aquificota bacterium]
MKNKIGIVILLVLIVAFGVFAFKWVKHRIEYAITDAVFVETEDMANLSFHRVGGRIIKLYKKEGDRVEKGEVLAKIDDTDYRVKLNGIQSRIKALEEKKKALQVKLEKVKKQIEIKVKQAELTKKQIQKEISALRKELKQVEAQIKLTKKDEERFRYLAEKDLIPKRKYEEVKTKLKVLTLKKAYIKEKIAQLKISLRKAEEGIKLAKSEEKTIPYLQREIQGIQGNIQALLKEAEDTQNLIKYTTLTSPYSGYIAKKFVSVGEVVPPSRPVYSVVPEGKFYIKVLLEETKLKGVKVGNPVKIHIDAYPDEEFEGVVEEINPATASKFALVPRDITAGEFTKVAQRIPIKVKITKGNTSLLKVGLSGEVEIKRTE